MKTALDYAAEYARCFDWRVFPLHTMADGRCTCGKAICDDAAKHPRTLHGLLDATSDQEQIAEWATHWPDANIGVATGQKSGFIALDIDPRHGGDDNLAELEREHGKLPGTVVSLTGGGGKHYLFLWPGEYVKSRQGDTAILPGVEIKGDGGYIVAPPSLHQSGQRYEWELSSRPGDVAIAPLPLWLLELLRGENKSNGRECLDEEPIKLIYEGARNVRLTSLAGTMRRRGMSEAAIRAALLVVNGESCVPPVSDSEVERIAHSVARYTPDNPPTLILPKRESSCAEWLDTYIEYAEAVSPMTPRVFHESGGLWLLSTAVARRLVLPMAHGAVYPNLYIIWLAATTLYRKTTGQAVPRDIATRLFPWLIAPQDNSPEALLNDMAGAEPPNLVHLTTDMQDEWRKQRNFAAQRGVVMDEMSGLMASAGRDYNAGLLEGYLRFYDCEKSYKRSTRGQGLQVVRNAYLSMLGASTPAALGPHISSGVLWANGWWPRFAILTPPEIRPAWEEPRFTPEPPGIAAGLQRLLERLPKGIWPSPAEALEVEIEPDAARHWAKYNKALSYDLQTEELDERFQGTYGRLPTQALKVAILLAALDWHNEMPAPVIEERHLLRALETVEQWRESVHRAITLTASDVQDRVAARILRYVVESGANGVTKRDIRRKMRDVNTRKIEDGVDQLVNFGEIEAVEHKTAGRSKVVYLRITE